MNSFAGRSKEQFELGFTISEVLVSLVLLSFSSALLFKQQVLSTQVVSKKNDQQMLSLVLQNGIRSAREGTRGEITFNLEICRGHSADIDISCENLAGELVEKCEISAEIDCGGPQKIRRSITELIPIF